MYQNYLITGATGFLGSAVVQLLLAHGCRVLALVMNNDPLIHTLPKNVTTFFGDLTDQDSLRDFFAAGSLIRKTDFRLRCMRIITHRLFLCARLLYLPTIGAAALFLWCG